MKRNTLVEFSSNHSIQISCTPETHLVIEDKFKIPVYKVYQKDRINRAGGMELLLLNNFSSIQQAFQRMLTNSKTIQYNMLYLLIKTFVQNWPNCGKMKQAYCQLLWVCFLPSSCRPPQISFLSSLGKVLEKLLLRRIDPIINADNIIPDHQFGSLRQHSTLKFKVI